MKALRFLHAARFQMPAPGWLPLWLMLAFVAPPGRALEPAPPFDLTGAVVVIPRHPSLQEQKAIQMLVEEVEKRTQVRWPSQSAWPTGGRNNGRKKKKTLLAKDIVFFFWEKVMNFPKPIETH